MFYLTVLGFIRFSLLIAKTVLAIMNVDLDEARLVVSELSMLKNSTLGLDSGLASSADVSQSSGDRSVSVSRRMSALSSIRGGVPPVGEFLNLE